MKKSFIYLAMLCITSIFISCKDEEDPTLEVSPATVTIPVLGTAQTVTVTSNVEWVVNKPGAATWLTVTPASGNGNGSFSVSATDNSDSKDPRNATLTVTAGGLTKSITVMQNGVDAPDAAGEITITGTFCDNQSAVLSIAAINRATSYQWYKDDAAIEGATGLSYTATSHGSYTVAGVNAAGEGAKSPAKVIEQCPLTINDLLGEWTVTEKQNMRPSETPFRINATYTITIALKAGTADSVTISGIGDPEEQVPGAGQTCSVIAKIKPANSDANSLLMDISAQNVTPIWEDENSYESTRFVAVVSTEANAPQANKDNGFTDVVITRAADGTISASLTSGTAPYSYAVYNVVPGGWLSVYVLTAQDTRWVKNIE